MNSNQRRLLNLSIGFNISSFVLIFARLSVPNSGNFECSSYLTLAYFLQTRHNFSPQWTQYGLVSAIPQFVLMVLFDRICKLILFPINHQNFLSAPYSPVAIFFCIESSSVDEPEHCQLFSSCRLWPRLLACFHIRINPVLRSRRTMAFITA